MKTRYILLFLFTVLVIADLQSQTATQNYIQSKTYTKEDATTYMEVIQYFDGLGRPVQTVQKGITPAKADLITYQEYDAFGRESRAWLPAVAASNNGAYMTLANFKTKAMATYNSTTYNAVADSVAYSRPVYEASPLSRVLEQYGPGLDWKTNKKAVRTGYLTNVAKAGTSLTVADSLVCAQYTSVDTRNTISVSRSGNYAVAQLYVTRMKDEDGNTSYEFKDKLGQVILTRQVNAGTLLDTYYIYDSFGNLRVVLPPMVSETSASGTWTDATVAWQQYAYLYKYDDRNRCVWKKLPGCEPIYYVYDKADRLIFTQDGEQRAKGEWLFSIPDAFGRVVLTGICKNTLDYAADPLKNVVVSAAWSKATNTYKGYTIAGITLTLRAVLSASYYDHYEFMGLNSIPANTDTNFKYTAESGYGTWYGIDYTDANKYKNKGLLTGTLTTRYQSDGTIALDYLYSVMYYDNKARLIQTKSTNHLGGIEKEYIAYDFTGQPTQKKHVHSATGKNTQTEVYAYTYDHAGRLTKTTHQLTDGTTVKSAVTLADNSYDELGRLKTNKKGGQANLNTTLAYNVRSWTKSITSPLFNQTLYYNESYGGSTKQYNGNISAMTWLCPTETTILRMYNYTYDNLSRLTKADYGENGTVTGRFNEQFTYDKHGNMLSVLRRGNATIAGSPVVDNLTLAYTGNQLNKMTDAATATGVNGSMDIKNYTNIDTEYTYNRNGAMNKDLNKGISDIQYNSLNLPRMMDIKSPVAEGRNEYTYTALGVKLKVVQKWNPNYSTTPVIGSGVNTTLLTQTKTTDYVGNIIYENGTLERILVDGGYIESGVYYFYLTDHLGNNRVVANQSGTVAQINSYYPFGMHFAPGMNAGAQPYMYNGKELDQMHGLNLYDYSARYYESAIGRFTTVDPLAEKYYSISPYAYCNNNPIKFVDPTGMWMDSTNTAEANRIRTSAQMRRTQLQIERNELVKNNQSTGDLDQRIDQLTTSMKDIDNMLGNENIEFRYGQTTGGGYIDLDNLASDGVVTMYVDNTMDMKIHESRHGGDVARGTLTAGNYNVAHEVSAYRAQYSYSGTFSYIPANLSRYEKQIYSELGPINGFAKSITNINQINRSMVNSMTEPINTSNGLVPRPMYPPVNITPIQWVLGFSRK